jgi:hypothetical protein
MNVRAPSRRCERGGGKNGKSNKSLMQDIVANDARDRQLALRLGNGSKPGNKAWYRTRRLPT